jgi:hypothetical protein
MDTKICGHYTSQAGLIEIIRSEKIWATNIKFLNDEHEFQHALKLIKEKIKTSKKIPQEHRDHFTFKFFTTELESTLETLDSYRSESIFTLSFSEETDLLSQWRGYCPNNNGFCLIFDVERLFEQVKSEYDNIHLVKCVYKDIDKNSQITDLLNKYWRKYLAKRNQKDKKTVLAEMAKEIMLLASYFKDTSFSEEKEQRIVVILDNAPDNDLKFRQGHFSIIPYIELPASRKNIKKICIGPTSSKELSKRALEMFLEKTYGIPSFFGDLEVEFSKTPYRPW